MLTNKGKYGLKALIHLACLQTGQTALSAEIAAANTIPKKFLDAILQDLKTAGFVYSKKGPGGGYTLAQPADEILIGRVIRALDGPLAPISCASRTAYRACADCGDVATCPVRRVMLRVRDAMSDVLDTISLQDLSRRPKSATGRLQRQTRPN
jgi:Rrf2 family protein